jgi:hypothetical protein
MLQRIIDYDIFMFMDFDSNQDEGTVRAHLSIYQAIE